MTTPPPHRRRYIGAAPSVLTTRLLLGALLVAGTLAGCSTTSNSSTSSQGGDAPAAQPADAKNAAGAEAAPPGAVAADPQKDSGAAQQAPTQVEPQQRSLIYTGSMSVKVPDVSVAADRAINIANSAGGSVGGDRRTLDADRSEAELVLRVPSEKFAATLDELAKLGVEQTRSVQAQDVTETLVDLDARLATQRASVERVRALLAKAQTIGEVVSIESELTRREADLASLEQRKDKLAALVALSTITVDLRGPAAPTPSGETPDTGFMGGLKSGWSAFVNSIKVVLVVAGWLLPWVIAVGLPIWLFTWLLRRRRRPATPATVTHAPAAASSPSLPTPRSEQ